MTTTANLVRPYLPQSFLSSLIQSFYTNTLAFRVFGEPQNWANQGNYVNWTVDVGATTNNGTTVTENGALPSVNVTTMAEAQVALATYATTGLITDQMLWRARTDVSSKDERDRTNELINTVNAALLSAFEGSIDATGSYAGLTRTSYTNALVSGEATHGGTVTAELLEAAIEWLMTSSAGGRNKTMRENMVIVAEDTFYFDILKLCEPSTSHVQQDGGDYGTIFHQGSARTFNGIPVIQGTGLSSGFIGIGDPGVVGIHESTMPQVRQLANDNLVTNYAVAWDGCIVNQEPAQWYKLTTA